MSKPAARIGDMHVCPMSDGPKPHVGGPVMGPGVPTVLIGGMPAAVMGDLCTCVGPPDTIVLGSTGVLIGGKPAARLGDMCAHGGTIIMGAMNVLIGEVSPGGPVTPTLMAPIMQEFKKHVNQAANGDEAVAEKAIEAASVTDAMNQAAFSGNKFVPAPTGWA